MTMNIIIWRNDKVGKKLVAYFSASGVTKKAAGQLAKGTGAEGNPV